MAGTLAAALALGAVATILLASGADGSSGSGRGIYHVRAIFDNAAFAVSGEDVRIAGAPVGSIGGLDVTSSKQAAVTLNISDPRFVPFHADATCAIRPQSLIGEKYVDCNPGSTSAPALPRIEHGAGAGSHLLPVARTSSPVDSDIVNDIYRQPIRQRFALIIDELGTGLAARGSDLNEVIHRANPALGYTDQVLRILARQNRQLAQLAVDSDHVLTPLAAARSQLAGFITHANTTSVASAARAAAISAGIRLFPGFLHQLRPLMVDLGQLADQGTPLMSSLAQGADALGRQFRNLTPFARAARPALIQLGHYSQLSQPELLGTIPLDQRLLRLSGPLRGSSVLLDRLLGSLDRTGGIEQLMSVLFNGTSAANGFDSTGHYLRDEPLVGACSGYATSPGPTCSSHLARGGASAAAAAVAVASHTQARPADRTLQGLLTYLIGKRQ